MNEESKITELIEKYISNIISDKELQLLYKYLNHEENNDAIEAYSRKKWQHNKNIHNITTENTWNKIKSRIAEDKSIKISFQKPIPRIVYTIIGYAAALALIILVSWSIYHFYTNKGSLAGNAYNEYIVPYGSKSTVILPDGSKIRLNSGSKIKYSGDFNKGERIVFLEGEAFFDVKPSEKKPFIVKTAVLNIRVFGTRFNVKSFKEEKNVETTLISGSVVVEKVDKNGRVIQNIQLKPNQIITYSKAEDQFMLKTSALSVEERSAKEHNIHKIEPIITIEPVIGKSVEEATSWVNNKLTFRGDSINTLISKLQRWYDVEITLKNKNLNKSTFTGTFDNETIEQALNALRLTTHFSYTIDKNKITIY
jgi:ferric-dicitrate binding protein FerR (iron transport regulator)